jgi:ABC-type amino acid transport substrate-binding protein
MRLTLTKFINVVVIACLTVSYSLYSPLSWSQNCSYLSYNGGDNLSPLFYRENGTSHGILSDVLNSAAKQEQISLILGHIKPWKRLLIELRQGNLDFLAGVTHSIHREQFFEFSEPISFINLRVYVNQNNSFKFNQLSDLKSLIGGKLLGMSFGDEVDNYAFNHLVIEEKLSLASLFKMLEYGRLDYVIMYENAGSTYIKENKLEQKITALAKPLHVNDVYIAASKHSYCYSNIKNILAEIKPPEQAEKLYKIKGSPEFNHKLEIEAGDK